MAESYRKLQFTDATGKVGATFNARYEKMDRDEKPKIEARVGDIVVVERTTYNDVILLPGMTKKLWVDEKGLCYAKEKIKFYYEGEEVSEKSQTKVFEIQAFQPVSAYTDMYVIDKFYEVFPDDNGCSKDIDKEIARKSNLRGMRKLWEYLDSQGCVARGAFNTSSRGFVDSDGYVRAIKFGNKWALEIGVFSMEKVFRHLQEGVPEAEAPGMVASGAGPAKRIKRI